MKDKVSELQRMLYDMAKADPNRRFHSLYDKIWRIDVLNAAWKQVKQNGGTYGVDHITIQDIKKNEEAELAEIQTELRTKTFKPSPLRRAYIPKSNGKMRGLGIPTIKDRIVQTAIKIVIEPIFESGFEPNSYGFRPDKSAHDAVDNIAKYLNFGCENVIDADITGCFDNIPKHELMEQISKRISDGAMLHIIRQFLDAGIMEGNEIHNTDRGTPQGSPLSPLLANIYLDQLDKQWKASGLENRNREDAHLIRYADDFVILVKGSAETAKIKLDEIMETIDLTLNKEKTRIVKAEEGFDFLGFRFVRKYSKRRGKRTTRWYPSPRSEQKIKEKIRELTDKSKLSIMTPEQAKEQLIPLLRGWGNYFAHSTVSTKLYEIWDYAQRRLMYLYCRQHNKPRTWKYRDIKKRHLYIVDTLPRTIASNRHKAM